MQIALGVVSFAMVVLFWGWNGCSVEDGQKSTLVNCRSRNNARDGHVLFAANAATAADLSGFGGSGISATRIQADGDCHRGIELRVASDRLAVLWPLPKPLAPWRVIRRTPAGLCRRRQPNGEKELSSAWIGP
jgi:hypothetical protein